jgi:hypothetical protein
MLLEVWGVACNMSFLVWLCRVDKITVISGTIISVWLRGIVAQFDIPTEPRCCVRHHLCDARGWVRQQGQSMYVLGSLFSAVIRTVHIELYCYPNTFLHRPSDNWCIHHHILGWTFQFPVDKSPCPLLSTIVSRSPLNVWPMRFCFSAGNAWLISELVQGCTRAVPRVSSLQTYFLTDCRMWVSYTC